MIPRQLTFFEGAGDFRQRVKSTPGFHPILRGAMRRGGPHLEPVLHGVRTVGSPGFATIEFRDVRQELAQLGVDQRYASYDAIFDLERPVGRRRVDVQQNLTSFPVHTNTSTS